MVRRRNRDVTRLLTAIACVVLVYLLYPHVRAFLSPDASPAAVWGQDHRGVGGQSGLDDVRAAVKSIAATKSTLPVFVVEEHHEVLAYWFTSAEHGIIPKKKNVLLHIDGHGDGAPPVLVTDFPLFAWPQSAQSIFAMMQRNDVFVMAAGVTGLIDRYIWVWPTWDKGNHDDEGLHAVWKAELGILVTDGEKGHTLCGCWQSVQHPHQSNCLRQNPAATNIDEFLSIPRARCTTSTVATVEFVQEEKALELLRGGEWITSKESVILDIDEDFYGCESAVMPLYKTGIDQNFLNVVTDLMSFLFCAEDADDEKSADLFYFAIIDMIVKMKVSCMTKDKDLTSQKDCASKEDVENVMIQLLSDLHKTLLAQPAGRTLCETNKIRHMLNLQSIVRILVPLNVSQLVQLAETGICLRTSPRGLYFNPEEGMQVCQGSNLPNSTAVFFHSPSPQEVQLRSAHLGRVFSSLKKSAGRPALVTLARSIRDGYTPRSYFHRIETDLLQMLKETFSDRHHSTLVHFDSYLLGGKGGWPRRHKQSVLLPNRRKKHPK